MDKPIFIKIEEYEEISQVLEDLRKKTEDARKKFQDIRALKDKEDAGLRDWEEKMDNINKYLDKMESLLNSG
jgi:hypothetical protein